MTFGMLEEEFPAGTEVFSKGEPCKYIIFIISGKVVINMEDENANIK